MVGDVGNVFVDVGRCRFQETRTGLEVHEMILFLSRLRNTLYHNKNKVRICMRDWYIPMLPLSTHTLFNAQLSI